MKLKQFFLSLFLISNLTTYTLKVDNLDYNSRLDAEGYSEMSLINDTTQKQMYRVNVIKGKKNDGSKYIDVQPKVITVMPLSKGIVKLFGVAPPTTEKGEYDFGIKISPITIPTMVEKKGGKLVSGAVTINAVPIIEMTGYVGDINFQNDIKIKDVKFVKTKDKKNIRFKALIENKSYATINFGAAFYNGSGGYLTSKNLITLGPHKSQKIDVVIPNLRSTTVVEKIELYRITSEGKQTYKVALKSKDWN